MTTDGRERRQGRERASLFLGLLAFVACWGPAGRAGAADWPQWRGPNRDGLSAETGLLKE